MDCRACQHWLLAAEDPARPESEIDVHLQACSSCRDWQRQLLRVEANVPRLPVPPSHGKDRLLRELLGQPAGQPRPAAAAPAQHPAPPPMAVPAAALTRRPLVRAVTPWAACAAAAAVLIAFGFLLGNWLSEVLVPPAPSPHAKSPEPQPAPGKQPEPQPAPTAPLTARLLEADLSLAQAESPRQRLQALADLADDLQDETRALEAVAGAADLDALARLYQKVIREGVVPRARSLPAGERRPVLEPIAQGLSRAREDARRLARTARPSSVASLERIAAAARDGDDQLRALMREDKP
jgi:hypothetical protein